MPCCAGRIHQAKDAFQHLLVLAACLLICQQACLDRRTAAPQGETLIARLKGMMTDHSLGLEGLAAELARAGAAPVGGQPSAGQHGDCFEKHAVQEQSWLQSPVRRSYQGELNLLPALS